MVASRKNPPPVDNPSSARPKAAQALPVVIPDLQQHDFVVQAVAELQKSVGGLSMGFELLREDLHRNADKVEAAIKETHLKIEDGAKATDARIDRLADKVDKLADKVDKLTQWRSFVLGGGALAILVLSYAVPKIIERAF